MVIRFWGVRGSIPTPVSNRDIREKIKRALLYARPSDILSAREIELYLNKLTFSREGDDFPVYAYGGNTTCIECRTDDGRIFIIDCGSGLRFLGNMLMQTEFAKGGGEAWFFVTHTHWDHIQGIPFFVPFYIKGNKFHFISRLKDLHERLSVQQDPRFFPITFDAMPAHKDFIYMEEDSINIDGVSISTLKMKHPGGSWAVRIKHNGKIFVFTSDAEIHPENEEENALSKYINFFNEANVLVFDTQYTLDELLTQKIDWGHSSSNIAIDLANHSNVENLVLFHHDPSYDDEKMKMLYLKANNYKEYQNIYKMNVIVAYEGLEIEI